VGVVQGDVQLRINAGVLQQSVDGGLIWANAGGASSAAPDWFTTVAGFIRALQPTLLTEAFKTECASVSVECELGAAAGSGTCVQDATRSGGVIISASGGTASSFRAVRSKGGAVAVPSIANLRTGKWAVASATKMLANPATFLQNLCAVSDEATFAVILGAIQTASGANWAAQVGSAAAVDLGVAFNLNWNTLIQVADGTNVKMYAGNQDGSSIVQIGNAGGYSQVTCPAAPGCWTFFSQNLGTAANCSAAIDKALVLTENPA